MPTCAAGRHTSVPLLLLVVLPIFCYYPLGASGDAETNTRSGAQALAGFMGRLTEEVLPLDDLIATLNKYSVRTSAEEPRPVLETVLAELKQVFGDRQDRLLKDAQNVAELYAKYDAFKDRCGEYLSGGNYIAPQYTPITRMPQYGNIGVDTSESVYVYPKGLDGDGVTRLPITDPYINKTFCVMNHDDMLDMFIANHKDDDGLSWQAFVADEGPMVLYPSNSELLTLYNENTDVRNFNWYGGAVALPHDVVVVLDRSESMNLYGAFNITQYAVKSFLESLNCETFVAVVVFSDDVQTLVFGDTLVQAVPKNIELLVDAVMALQPGGTTDINKGLKRAEIILTAGNTLTRTSGCDGAVLLISDGQKDDKKASQLDYSKSFGDGRKLRYFTYSLGQTSADMMMWTSACETGGIWSSTFVKGSVLEKLRNYGSYEYEYLRNNPTIHYTVPYEDRLGAGLVMSMSVPVFSLTHSKPRLLGVMLNDFTLASVLQTLDSFFQSDWSYPILSIHGYRVYINSLSGTAEMHPLVLSEAEDGISEDEMATKAYEVALGINQGDGIFEYDLGYRDRKLRFIQKQHGIVPASPISLSRPYRLIGAAVNQFMQLWYIYATDDLTESTYDYTSITADPSNTTSLFTALEKYPTSYHLSWDLPFEVLNEDDPRLPGSMVGTDTCGFGAPPRSFENPALRRTVGDSEEFVEEIHARFNNNDTSTSTNVTMLPGTYEEMKVLETLRPVLSARYNQHNHILAYMLSGRLGGYVTYPALNHDSLRLDPWTHHSIRLPRTYIYNNLTGDHSITTMTHATDFKHFLGGSTAVCNVSVAIRSRFKDVETAVVIEATTTLEYMRSNMSSALSGVCTLDESCFVLDQAGFIVTRNTSTQANGTNNFVFFGTEYPELHNALVQAGVMEKVTDKDWDQGRTCQTYQFLDSIVGRNGVTEVTVDSSCASGTIMVSGVLGTSLVFLYLDGYSLLGDNCELQTVLDEFGCSSLEEDRVYLEGLLVRSWVSAGITCPAVSSSQVEAARSRLPFNARCDFDGNESLVMTLGLSAPWIIMFGGIFLRLTIYLVKKYGKKLLRRRSNEEPEEGLEPASINAIPSAGVTEGSGGNEENMFTVWNTDPSRQMSPIPSFESSGVPQLSVDIPGGIPAPPNRVMQPSLGGIPAPPNRVMQPSLGGIPAPPNRAMQCSLDDNDLMMINKALGIRKKPGKMNVIPSSEFMDADKAGHVSGARNESDMLLGPPTPVTPQVIRMAQSSPSLQSVDVSGLQGPPPAPISEESSNAPTSDLAMQDQLAAQVIRRSVKNAHLYSIKSGHRFVDEKVRLKLSYGIRTAVVTCNSERSTLELAAMYIDDAMKGLPPQYHVNNALHKALHRIHCSSWYFRLLDIVITINLALGFFENFRFTEGSGDSSVAWASSLELVCLLFYAICVSMEFVYHGYSWSNWRKALVDWWFAMRVAIILIMFFEAIFYLAGLFTIRVSRILRPVLFLWNPKMRREIMRIVRSVPKVADMSALLALNTVVFAFIGSILFYGLDSDTKGTDPNGSFNSIISSCITMYVMISAENYPDVMRPAYSNNPYTVTFFILFWVVTVVLLISNITGALAESYSKEGELQRRKILSCRVQSLAVCYGILVNRSVDGMDSHTLYTLLKSSVVFQQDLPCLVRMRLRLSKRGRATEEKVVERIAEAIFKAMDSEENESLDVFEFITLPGHMTERPPKPPNASGVFCDHQPIQFMLRIVESSVFQSFTTAVVIWAIVIQAFSTDGGERVISRSGHTVLEVLVYVSYATFVLELLIKAIAYGRRAYWADMWNRFDTFVLFMITVSFIMEYLPQFSEKTGIVETQILQGFRALRVFRLAAKIDKIKRLLKIMYTLLIRLAVIMWISLLIMYSYAIVGTELWGDIDVSFMQGPDARVCNFLTLASSHVCLAQIVVGNKWHYIMYDAVLAHSRGSWAELANYRLLASLFFISYHYIASIVILNLITANFVDEYLVLSRKLDEEEEECDNDDIAEATKIDLATEYPSLTHGEITKLVNSVNVQRIASKKHSLPIPSPSQPQQSTAPLGPPVAADDQQPSAVILGDMDLTT